MAASAAMTEICLMERIFERRRAVASGLQKM